MTKCTFKSIAGLPKEHRSRLNTKGPTCRPHFCIMQRSKSTTEKYVKTRARQTKFKTVKGPLVIYGEGCGKWEGVKKSRDPSEGGVEFCHLRGTNKVSA